MSYGTVDGVQTLVRHLPFDDANGINPHAVAVQDWLIEASTQLDALLRARGYPTPVIVSGVLIILGSYANHYGAGMTERSMAPALSSQKDDTERGDRWFRHWETAAAWIASGALEGLGVVPSTPPRPVDRAVTTTAYTLRVW